MGHKGVSKRKPKKSNTVSNGKTDTHPDESSPIRSLLKINEAVRHNKGGSNSANESGHKNKKGK